MVEEKVLKAREEFKKLSLDNKGYISYFGWASKDGKFTSQHGPCHAAISGANPPFEVDYIFDSFQRLKVGVCPATAKLFMSWLIKDSPWQSAFITKDATEAMEQGSILTTSVPGDFIMGALIAGRTPTENYDRMAVWKIFVDHGVDPTLAYVYTCLYSKIERNGLTYNPRGAGHWTYVPEQGDWKYVENFLTANYKKSPPYKEKRDSFGASAVWGPVDPYSRNRGPVDKAIRPLVPTANKRVKNFNIFYKEPVGVSYLFGKEDIPDLVEQLNAIVYKNVNIRKVA